MTLNEFGDLLNTINDLNVFHCFAEQQEYPYLVYHAPNPIYDTASSKPYRERIPVELAHFSKMQSHPTFERLKEVLFENDLFFNVISTYDHDSEVFINQLELTIWRNL